MSPVYHLPALLQESLAYLNVRPDGFYVDATFGGGGHTRAILNALGQAGRLLAFDQDPDARRNLPDDPRLTFVPENFDRLADVLESYPPLDGILADLGVSFHQFDTPIRGFSFRFDAPLDMRMNTNDERTAADIVNTSRVDELAALFRQYGELPRAGSLAQSIIAARPLRTTFGLNAAVAHFWPERHRAQGLAQVYQALRIEVNGELDALKALLVQGLDVLAPGGRMVVLSYHSLEDRLVKHFFQAGNFEGNVETDFYGRRQTPWRNLTRKPITPSTVEVAANPRARSAKLRAAEKSA